MRWGGVRRVRLWSRSGGALWDPPGYLLSADVPARRALGSLSDPGIFHGPGETVVFLPAELLLPGGASRLSPGPRSGSLALGATSSLLFPLVCGSRAPPSPGPSAVLSLDRPLQLLEGLASSLPPSPSAPAWTLRPLSVDLPPSLAALLPWLLGSRFHSSAFWGLLERSFLPSPATRSRATSRGGRRGRSGGGAM